MSAPSGLPFADQTGLADRPGVGSSEQQSTQQRLSSPRPTDGVVSESLRGALCEAAGRAAPLLAETVGKTAEEIQNQLDAIVELIPILVSGATLDAADESRCNVPRRYIDVMRSELLAGLSEL